MKKTPDDPTKLPITGDDDMGDGDTADDDTDDPPVTINQVPESNKKYFNPPETPANKLIGVWKATEEELDGETYKAESEINFKSVNTVESTTLGIMGYPKYKLYEGSIVFYESESDLKYEGTFNEAEVSLEGNELTITLPQFPKTIVYTKQ